MIEASESESVFTQILVGVGLSYTYYTYAPEGRTVSSALMGALFAVLMGLCILASLIVFIALRDTLFMLHFTTVILGLVSRFYYELYRSHCGADLE